jgi:ferredoxin
MSMEIRQALCIFCADCETVCPTRSISQSGGKIQINPDSCTECMGTHDAPQCVEVCPTEGCIVPAP